MDKVEFNYALLLELKRKYAKHGIVQQRIAEIEHASKEKLPINLELEVRKLWVDITYGKIWEAGN